MKKIWQYGRTGGKELEVSDDFPIQVPFTDVPPIEEIELANQFFVPTENRWQELENSVLSEQVDNLQVLYKYLEKNAKRQEGQLTETQLALTEVYELILGGG
ncbi:hypothetical protein [Enterococcus mundtii]|uniref:hypothetical protein n=1 Tax=Enterococcus mundtii TaxID=53346 RepID=UPI002DB5BEE3|nr:hypothetical protein [Enterococcus mundtii]MEC3942574.1 hypothetical protein [Enterococcus mundtii]